MNGAVSSGTISPSNAFAIKGNRNNFLPGNQLTVGYCIFVNFYNFKLKMNGNLMFFKLNVIFDVFLDFYVEKRQPFGFDEL